MDVVIDQDGVLKNVGFTLSKGKCLDCFEDLFGAGALLGSLN